MSGYIIFDFDGTLADTNAGIVATFKKTMEILGIPSPTESEITATIGLPLKQNFLTAVKGMSDEMADECARTYRSIFDETAIPTIKAFPGVKETLTSLHERGIRMVIATSRSHRSLKLISDNLGISRYFCDAYCAEDVRNHKPAPDIVNLILKNHNITPDDALVVGDTTFDLMMGQAAGCKVCGVTWGNHTEEMLRQVNPDYIIQNISDLIGLL